MNWKAHWKNSTVAEDKISKLKVMKQKSSQQQEKLGESLEISKTRERWDELGVVTKESSGP